MITVHLDTQVANLLKATSDLIGETDVAVRSGVRKAITYPRGLTLIRWEFQCSEVQANEIRQWLRESAGAIQATKPEFAGELLVAERDIAHALTAEA
jgi:hypothetical protein